MGKASDATTGNIQNKQTILKKKKKKKGCEIIIAIYHNSPPITVAGSSPDEVDFFQLT
jgi:hypothetical protein